MKRPVDPHRLLDQMAPAERAQFLGAVAAWMLKSVLEDLEREPPKAKRVKREPITDLAQLPLMLTLQDVAAVYRISPLTIRRGLQGNTFYPLPFEKYPYRWLREDVLEDLKKRRTKLKTRRHGFAAAKAKRDAAE